MNMTSIIEKSQCLENALRKNLREQKFLFTVSAPAVVYDNSKKSPYISISLQPQSSVQLQPSAANLFKATQMFERAFAKTPELEEFTFSECTFIEIVLSIDNIIKKWQLKVFLKKTESPGNASLEVHESKLVSAVDQLTVSQEAC